MQGLLTLDAASHRKPLAAPLALAPLGGLLAICVFFLFVTARFDDIVALPSVPTWPAPRSAHEPRLRDLSVRLSAQGFVLRVARGLPMRITRRGPSLDLNTLCTNAHRMLEQHADIRVVRLVPEDGVPFVEVVESYDTLLAKRCAP